MLRPIILLTAAASATFSIAALGPASAQPADQAVTAAGAGSYIVVLDNNVAAGRVASQHEAAYGVQVSHVYRFALKGYSASMSASAVARIQTDSRVQSVQPDGVVQADAQTLPTGINRVDGELSSTVSGNGSGAAVDVDVAVIDTGIDLDHPDLNVYTAGAKNCSTGNSANDGNGHGTHVSGTIGALDNGIGVVGVAPGARLWPVRVLNNAGSGTWSSVICGIDYVTAHASQIEVANMSLGGSGSDDTCGGRRTAAMHQAICNSVGAGVTYAVAAGNSATDAKGFVPAAYDQVITVSALADFNGEPGGGAAPTCRSDVDDTFADFSNYGADVDIIAPGVCILSTWKGGGYNTISGTSMATPHVTGAAALYKATHPSASPSSVQSALQSAGTTQWSTSTDPDGTHEKLLNVSTF